MGTFSNDLNSCSRTRDEYLQEQQHEAEIKLLNEQKEEQNRQRQNELIQDKLRRERYSLFVNEIKSTLLKAASQGLYVDQKKFLAESHMSTKIVVVGIVILTRYF